MCIRDRYWYNKSAEQGNANAQYALGWMYENGEGVVKDLAMAFRWYKRAAERNHPAAQTNLGWMYENGKGVVKDDVQSVFWYRQAAELGQAEGQLNLGICLLYTSPSPRD